jgi:hypothetical protein
VVALAKAVGFVIAAEGVSSEEIAEKELENVAGGLQAMYSKDSL